jgi:hypothetical protein
LSSFQSFDSLPFLLSFSFFRSICDAWSAIYVFGCFIHFDSLNFLSVFSIFCCCCPSCLCLPFVSARSMYCYRSHWLCPNHFIVIFLNSLIFSPPVVLFVFFAF